MSRPPCAVLPLLLLASVWSPAAAAQEVPRHSLEVGLYGGYASKLGPPTPRKSHSPLFPGLPVALEVVYRTPYFLAPFLEVGYDPIFASEDPVDLGPLGGKTTARSSLSTLHLTGGAELDVWRLRFMAGVGLHDLRVSSTVMGKTALGSELDMGYFLAAGARLAEWAGFVLGAELRVYALVTSGVEVGSLGLTVSTDAARW